MFSFHILPDKLKLSKLFKGAVLFCMSGYFQTAPNTTGPCQTPANQTITNLIPAFPNLTKPGPTQTKHTSPYVTSFIILLRTQTKLDPGISRPDHTVPHLAAPYGTEPKKLDPGPHQTPPLPSEPYAT